jgi:flagellar L-ring protein precursor FlgH
MRKFALGLSILPLAACGTVAETVGQPQLAPVTYPAVLAPTEQVVLPTSRGPLPAPASANSLWRVGASAFFNDQRANRVGDILTVQVEIDDSAATSNASTSSRGSSANVGVPNMFGLESSISRIFPDTIDPANLVTTNSANSNSGAGAITRQEKISLTVAVIVTQVLPNGNRVISGNQEVRVNNEVRHLSVDGIIRPEDITAANTIRSEQIAQARIDYGGRGDQSRVQKTPAGQSLIERFSPF